MREFYGTSAKEFFETKGKRFLIKPAVMRHLPKAEKGERFLDVGCGTAAFYEVAEKKGYKYYGLDASKDMIDRAVSEHPKGGYIVAKATSFAHFFKGKFDAMLISMVFPSLASKTEMEHILQECKKVLKDGAPLLLAVAHPTYDHYMQAGLLGRKNVKLDFAGYFHSGATYTTERHTESKIFHYQNHHWTLQDYFDVLFEAGFSVVALDECMPGPEVKKADKIFFDKRMRWPTYLLLKATPR